MGGQQVHEVQIGGLSGSLNSINSMRLEKVQISDKLVKGAHVTIKILEFRNIEGHDEENSMFLFGNSNIPFGKKQGSSSGLCLNKGNLLIKALFLMIRWTLVLLWKVWSARLIKFRMGPD